MLLALFIIDLYFLSDVVIAETFNFTAELALPTNKLKKKKNEIKTQPVTAVVNISKSSI